MKKLLPVCRDDSLSSGVITFMPFRTGRPVQARGSFEGAHAVGVEPGPPAVWTVWPGTVLFSGGGRIGGVQEPCPVPVILW